MFVAAAPPGRVVLLLVLCALGCSTWMAVPAEARSGCSCAAYSTDVCDGKVKNMDGTDSETDCPCLTKGDCAAEATCYCDVDCQPICNKNLPDDLQPNPNSYFKNTGCECLLNMSEHIDEAPENCNDKCDKEKDKGSGDSDSDSGSELEEASTTSATSSATSATSSSATSSATSRSTARKGVLSGAINAVSQKLKSAKDATVKFFGKVKSGASTALSKLNNVQKMAIWFTRATVPITFPRLIPFPRVTSDVKYTIKSKSIMLGEVVVVCNITKGRTNIKCEASFTYGGKPCKSKVAVTRKTSDRCVSMVRQEETHPVLMHFLACDRIF